MMSGGISSLTPYYLNFVVFMGALLYFTRGKLTSFLVDRRNTVISQMVNSKVELKGLLLDYNALLNREAAFEDYEQNQRKIAEESLKSQILELRRSYQRKSKKIEDETRALLSRIEKEKKSSLARRLIDLGLLELEKGDMSNIFALPDKVRIECQTDNDFNL